jgi:hypothetical protein
METTLGYPAFALSTSPKPRPSMTAKRFRLQRLRNKFSTYKTIPG